MCVPNVCLCVFSQGVDPAAIAAKRERRLAAIEAAKAEAEAGPNPSTQLRPA